MRSKKTSLLAHCGESLKENIKNNIKIMKTNTINAVNIAKLSTKPTRVVENEIVEMVNNTKLVYMDFVLAPTAPIKQARVIKNVSGVYVLSLNDLFETVNIAARFVISKINSFRDNLKRTPVRVQKAHKKLTKLNRLLRALRAAARRFWKWLLEELRRWHESNKTKYKFKYGFPKNKKELALLIRALANLYVSEFNNFLLFIALFDLLRFRILEKLWYAFFGKKWKVFFYLLRKMLKIPLIMLIISLATQNPYGGGTFLCYAIPFYLFLQFRIPVVSYLLENMFSEIFPAEVAQRAIASSTASIKSTALEFPLAKEILESPVLTTRAKEILARLANSANFFAEFANKKQK